MTTEDFNVYLPPVWISTSPVADVITGIVRTLGATTLQYPYLPGDTFHASLSLFTKLCRNITDAPLFSFYTEISG